jgi:hypothetical protein
MHAHPAAKVHIHQGVSFIYVSTTALDQAPRNIPRLIGGEVDTSDGVGPRAGVHKNPSFAREKDVTNSRIIRHLTQRTQRITKARGDARAKGWQQPVGVRRHGAKAYRASPHRAEVITRVHG